ncbi:MAG: class I SAM-dependent methyltransferase [Balneolaceae bacterium]
MTKKEEFDYQTEMKEYYKSDQVAAKYHQAYKESLRARMIAKYERKAVYSLLKKVPHSFVLDIPTGTGKLASVFKKSASRVLACDISDQMLKIAKNEFRSVDHDNVAFQVCDAEKISDTIDESFDVAVCLRLLHRVPDPVKRSILDELGKAANHVIVSIGVESRFHSIRRKIRELIMGGDIRDHCYVNKMETVQLMTDGFEIIESKAVFPFLSQEQVFLLKPHKR